MRVKRETASTEVTCTDNANVVCKSEIRCTQIDNVCGFKSKVTCTGKGHQLMPAIDTEDTWFARAEQLRLRNLSNAECHVSLLLNRHQ